VVTEEESIPSATDNENPIMDFVTSSSVAEDGADIRNVLSAYKSRMQQKKKQAKPAVAQIQETAMATNPTTNPRQCNMGITYTISKHAHTFGSLIDRGANGGLVGDDVRIIAKTGKFVDVAGIDNHTVNDLELVTAAGYVNTNRGPRIVILNQYAYLGKGKTIHCCAQLEHFKNNVDDRSRKVGGLQRILTLDGTVLPLAVRSGLAYLDIRPPTDEELETLPHIILTSDDVWDPSIMDYEHDASDDFAASFPDNGFVIDARFDDVGNYQLAHLTDLTHTDPIEQMDDQLLVLSNQDKFDHHQLEPVPAPTPTWKQFHFKEPFDPWLTFTVTKLHHFNPRTKDRTIHTFDGIDTNDPGGDVEEYISCLTQTNSLELW
jgi:hypothetical protein